MANSGSARSSARSMRLWRIGSTADTKDRPCRRSTGSGNPKIDTPMKASVFSVRDSATAAVQGSTPGGTGRSPPTPTDGRKISAIHRTDPVPMPA